MSQRVVVVVLFAALGGLGLGLLSVRAEPSDTYSRTQGSAAGLTWKPDGQHLQLVLETNEKAFLVVDSGKRRPSKKVGHKTGAMTVPRRTKGVTVYALVPVLQCVRDECGPCTISECPVPPPPPPPVGSGAWTYLGPELAAAR